MDRAALGSLAVGILGQPRDDQQLIPEGFQGLENRPEFKARPDHRRRPFFDDHPVWQVNDAEAFNRLRRSLDESRERRNHAVE